MRGRQAKTLSEADIRRLLSVAASSKSPDRNAVIVQLSVRAGLRASEIAKLEWSMVLDASGKVGNLIALPGSIVKYGLGRRVPVHRDLKLALMRLWRDARLAHGLAAQSPMALGLTAHCPTAPDPTAPNLTVLGSPTLRSSAYASSSPGPVVMSQRGAAMRPDSIVNWFTAACREAGLAGCTSHSGRRTFVTRAARLVHKAGGSLRDVQQLAGHRSIQTTQGYIDGDSDAQRRLVRLM